MSVHANDQAQSAKLLGSVVLAWTLLTLSAVVWLSRFEAAENYLPLWDQRTYFSLAADLTTAANTSFDRSIAVLRESLRSTHNSVYALPIAVAQFGAELTWPSYRRALVLLFLVPTIISISLLAASIVTRFRVTAFWVAVAISSALPALWDSTLKYYPDVSGLVLICIALGILGSRVEGRSSVLSMLLVGTLFAGAVLLRRHFVYAAAAAYTAFFAVPALRAAIQAAREDAFDRNTLVRTASLVLWPGLNCLASGLWLCLLLHLVAPVYFQQLFLDQSSLYAGYRVPADQLAISFVVSPGGIATALAVLGLWLGFRTGLTKPLRVHFIVAYVLTWFILWFTTASYLGPQYMLHVFPVLQGIGLTLFVITLLIRGQRTGLLLGALLVTGLLYRQWIHPLTGIGEDGWATTFLGASPSPNKTHQPDRESYIRLVQNLRENGGENKKVFVAASSFLMSAPLIESADEMWVRTPGQLPLKVQRTPDVDARDGLPVVELLSASFVVVADPTQYHLPPAAQTIVELAALSPNEAGAFSASFVRWKEEYQFARGGFRVFVYERVRDLDLQAGLDLLEHLMVRGTRGEVSWFPIQGAHKDIAGANLDGSNWLYYEPLLSKVPVGETSFASARRYSGKVRVDADLRVGGCEPSHLSVHVVPSRGTPSDPVALLPLRNTAADEFNEIRAEVSLTLPSRLMARVSSTSGACNVYFKTLRVSQLDR